METTRNPGSAEANEPARQLGVVTQVGGIRRRSRSSQEAPHDLKGCRRQRVRLDERRIDRVSSNNIQQREKDGGRASFMLAKGCVDIADITASRWKQRMHEQPDTDTTSAGWRWLQVIRQHLPKANNKLSTSSSFEWSPSMA